MAVKDIGITPQKALESVLYIASRLKDPDLHEVLKIRYFADKIHLSEYGFSASGDRYVAMNFGPVASNTYDLLKVARGTASDYDTKRFASFVKGALKVDPGKPHRVHALREADRDSLSRSDIESIDRAVALYGEMEFEARTKLSHDAAYEAAWTMAREKKVKQHQMSLNSIAGTLDNAEEVLAHISA